MPGLFAKFDCDILVESKIIEAGPEGFTMWSKGILYGVLHLTDGFVPDSVIPLIGAGIKKPKRVAERLVEVGLWIKCENGYRIEQKKWEKHHVTREEVEKKRLEWRTRKEAQRQRELQEKQAVQVQTDEMSRVTNDELKSHVTRESRECHANVTPPDPQIHRSTDPDSKKETSTKSIERFQKPTQEEIKGYMSEQGFRDESSKFFDYYQSKGWKIGTASMKDWKASVRNWIRNANARGPTNGAASMSNEELGSLALANLKKDYGI
jgi:hypothetical protein